MTRVANNRVRDLFLRVRMGRDGTLSKARDLHAVPLFADCSRSELHTLVGLTSEARARAGTVLCREGERPAQFLILTKGRLEVTAEGRGAETWSPGSYVPASGTRLHTAKTPTVRAESDVEIIVMNAREFATMIDRVPSVRAQLSGVQPDELIRSPATSPGMIETADIQATPAALSSSTTASTVLAPSRGSSPPAVA
jgi:CRP-like cAMP-binding protein